MNPAFPFVPEQASSVAGEVDALFLFILGVTGVFALGIWIALFYFAIRYRRRAPDERPAEIHGSLVLELTWTIVPLTVIGCCMSYTAENEWCAEAGAVPRANAVPASRSQAL